MFNTIKSGGIMMIPIFICGIIATYIIVERIIYFAKTKKKDAKLVADVKEAIRKIDCDEAMSLCDQAATPCAKVIKKAIMCRSMDENHLKEIVQTEMDSVVPRFEHLLTALGTVASISTLLGLLGTVTGNIKAFGVLGNGGTMGDPTLLANAIAEALVTTVGGLVVSIPSIIFNNFFNSQVNHRIREMETAVTEVMFALTGRMF